MGRRLPLRTVSASVRRLTIGLALAVGMALGAGLLSLLTFGPHAGVTTAAILAPVGVATVAVIELWIARRAHLGSVARQLRLAGAIVVGQLLLSAGLFAALMTSSTQDAVFIAVVAVYAGALGAWGARTVARRMLSDLDALGGGLRAIAGGRRDISQRVGGGDELARLAAELEGVAVRLGEEEHAHLTAEDARRDLIRSVSHDLRTPITSLRLLSDALDDDLVDAPTRREYVSRMGTHVRALGGLIDDLFELSRLESGQITWTMEQVALGELVHETVEAMRPEAEARSVSVLAELPGELQFARANPEQIQRVLFNLIHNAIRHTPADGSVTVCARPARGEVEIEVADTGEGIPEPERERMFTPFVQGTGRSARSDGSAGLGLAIARAIVEAHGGRIWMADAAVGTRVRFSLPRAAHTA